MLSISNPRKGAAAVVQYYTEGLEGYYLNGVDQPGQWFGAGAAKLRLQGHVDPVALRNLLDGYSPDRRRALVQNAGQDNRQSCWDMTLSPPKSFSVFWAFSPPAIQRELEAMHQRAVEKTLLYGEKACGMTRRGKGGMIEEEAALIFAMFLHRISRAQQPQIHTHALLLNAGLRQDGTAGTLKSFHFFQQKMMLGALYQAELAHELSERWHLQIEPEKVGFHIRGVSRELCREFSERRRQIEHSMHERGQRGAVAAKAAALETRPEKAYFAPAELAARWQKVGQDFGWGMAQALELTLHRPQEMEPAGELPDKLQQALIGLPPEKRTRRRVLKLATELATRLGANAQTLLESLRPVQLSKGQPMLRLEWRRVFDPTPWVPARRQYLRTEWQQPFATAWWGPARKFKLPVLAVELPRLTIGPAQQFKPRWGSIAWRRHLILGELRAQQRFLFPKAPKWSPLHGLSFLAFRFTPRSSKSTPSTLQKEIDDGHSH